jgi:hypothetical protein
MERPMTETTDTPTQGFVVPLARVFGFEIDQAKRLGYRVEAHVTGTAAVVRLVPTTQRTTKIAAATAPEGTQAPALQGVQVYDMPQHRLEAVQSAFSAALTAARDAAA